MDTIDVNLLYSLLTLFKFCVHRHDLSVTSQQGSEFVPEPWHQDLPDNYIEVRISANGMVLVATENHLELYPW